MNQTAEETYERERPIRLLYEGITQSATLQSISKSQGSWRIVYRSSHLWRLALKQKIKGKYLKHCTFATNVPKCTKISISFQALPHHILCATLTVCLVPVFLGSTSVLEKKGQ